MSIACHWSLIVKFYDHHGICGFMAHWDVIRWLLYPVMFRVISVFAWSVIQDGKGGQALELLFFPFYLSWCFLGVAWVYIGCG